MHQVFALFVLRDAPRKVVRVAPILSFSRECFLEALRLFFGLRAWSLNLRA